jgi:23S rRNA (cytosine1962-C5)-methyltransferase
VLHHGKPCTIDDKWLSETIADALEVRRPLLERGDTNAFRLVHGENDGLGGLVVDVYGNNAVIKIYSEAWTRWLPYVVAAILDAGVELPDGISRVVLRQARTVADDHRDGDVLFGPAPGGPVEFVENGLRFQTDLQKGHKTGHFLDQRDNRQLVRDLSDGRRVLDVFACTGGFSVHAAAGGATEVTSVDISGPALDLASANMVLNADDTSGSIHRTEVGDAFDVLDDLAKQGRRFDLVVLDPPAFAQRKNQVGRAIRAYERLAALGARVVEPGGLLLQASCSSRVSEADLVDAVHVGLERSGRDATELRRTGQPVDHPVGFEQGRYLKAVLLRVN